jgi:TonB family protein
MAIDLPEVVVNKLNEMKAAAPDKKFIVIEPDKKDENGVSDVQKKTEGLDGSQITTMNVMKDITDKNGNVRSFIIIEYDEVAEQVAMSSRTGEVFTMVEQSATYKGGMEALGSFISDNLVYPEEARTKGLQGKVFVQFIVNADGSISDPAIKKGVDTQLDNAALAVVKAMPNWNPGMQKGKAVRQQFVLPVNFALGE